MSKNLLLVDELSGEITGNQIYSKYVVSKNSVANCSTKVIGYWFSYFNWLNKFNTMGICLMWQKRS
ncbi:hypothetical protein NQ317_016326 [Molorchus minor]|uniref:Uncharacterized protein n=1 Tax=Molorchus minor TaxID=1323400 RepID=A0ABQ9IYG9_9CUCU|nr:hypothetical protein NQ317_016326 [Molorchus minor]